MPKKNKKESTQKKPATDEMETPLEMDVDTDELKSPAVTESLQPKVVKAGDKPIVNKSTNKPNGPTKKRLPYWAWIAILFGVLVVIVAAASFMYFGKGNKNTNQTTNSNTSASDLVARQLDGVLVESSKANTNIFAVMIENIKESRPPSGLDKASVVYEALAEGGITRFLALFPVGQSVSEIGPVRSARPYYISWAEEYKPLYVHVGGSPQALDYLRTKKGNLVDFNQFYNAPYFWRDKARSAPHNLYTDIDKLYMGLKRAAPENVPAYEPWLFKDEASLNDRQQTVNDIVINFSSFNYKVAYKYDRAMNRYQRYVADVPHVTRDNNQIYAKDVIVQFTKTSLIAGDKQRLEMETVGTGRMLMFRDGVSVEGTWKKDSATARTRWYDKDGNELAINPGPIWIEIVPQDREVTF